METLKVLKEQELLGKDFKVYGSIESPLFLAKDVASWIEIRNHRDMLIRIDEDEKVVGLTDTLGGEQETTFLTEDGLYEVLMQSRKPIAKQFKKEVKQILKQIRLTGGTIIEDREEEFINKYFTSFSDDVKKVMVIDLQNQNKKFKNEIKQLKPKAEYHDNVLQSDKLITSTDIAKDLGMSARKLNQKLNDLGIIYKQGKVWKLYSKYQHRVPEYCDYHINEYSQLLKFTEKGRKWIIELLNK